MNNTQKKILFIGILLAGCMATSVFSNFNSEEKNDDFHAVAQSQQTNAKQTQNIRIYVSGAVLEPGMYDLPAGSRAEDAVKTAGGFTAEADVARVNLARKLKDGNQVNVPFLKNSKCKIAKNAVNTESSRSSKMQAAAKNEKQTRIKINSASLGELQKLPGVGPALAQRIIAERERVRFTSVDGLLRVKGIGKAKLERLRELVEVD